MPTTDQLSEEISTLADEELIDRLRSENLTEIAADTIRRELVARGVDLACTLPQPGQGTVSPPRISAAVLRKFAGILARVLRFPRRAVLGLESFWAVIVFGAVFLFLLFKLLAYGLVQFFAVWPMPPYALPIAYVVEALMVLAKIWYALALWRSARRAKLSFWKIAVRVFAALVALYTVFGTPGRISMMQHYFSSPQGSVTDSLPKR